MGNQKWSMKEEQMGNQKWSIKEEQKWLKGQTTIYKTLQRKQKIKQHEPH
jgi:hypothetical protein